MSTPRNLALLSLLGALSLSACAPDEYYDNNGNYRGASDHGGTYQAPVGSDDHYYRSGNDSTNLHHKHNTVQVPAKNSTEYDHNLDPDAPSSNPDF